MSRLVLTGTPIENRLSDLWSLYDFLNPGLLGTHKHFKDMINDLENNEESYAPIKRLISPFLLRRLKSDKKIIDELPDKVETYLYCQLTEEQAVLYQLVVDDLKEKFATLDDTDEDMMKRRGAVLQCLMRLKQLLNHPSQMTGDMDWKEDKSGKFMRLTELATELAERQERVLVFTQYREIIVPLFNHLAKIFGRPGLQLHGGTSVKERQKLVDSFQRPDGPPFFILSLKAGGTGLNLTNAGHVIHFDRWWNPAVEDQATDRAYRIGQKKNVLVHKCVTLGTLEERIDTLLMQKKSLAQEVLGSNEEINLLNLDDEALLKLVSLDINKALIQ
jgi:non-specific serine/threonine protein kinase